MLGQLLYNIGTLKKRDEIFKFSKWKNYLENFFLLRNNVELLINVLVGGADNSDRHEDVVVHDIRGELLNIDRHRGRE